MRLRSEVRGSVWWKTGSNAQKDGRSPLDVCGPSCPVTCAHCPCRDREICDRLTGGGTTVRAFYLNDHAARRVGYCFREGDRMVLVDMENNVFRVSPETSAREAVRILLSHQQMIM